jgi:acyl-CoA synthetase (AMP-forming)/AMP-acid ligase II
MDATSLMRKAATLFADRTAIVHGANRLTYREAWDRSVRLANGLLALGLKPGDRIAVLEDNCIESSDIFQAAAIANLVRVPLYARDSREAHLHMAGHTNCRALIVASHHAAAVDGLTADLPDLEHVIVRDDTYGPWLAAQSPVDPMIPAHEDDFHVIRHTGGTTGKAKGVAYSHKSWLNVCRDWFYIFPQVNPGDVCLHVGPISHGSGYQYLPVFLAGGCNLMIDRFDALETLQLIERERVAYALLVPAMLSAMTRHPDARKYDYSSLKCILSGAGPIQDATTLASRDLFGDILYQGYGQTEIPPVAFMGPQQWFAEVEGSTPLRACGMVLPFSDVQIWDEDENPLPLGEEGEIVAKGDGRMTCFWNDAELTRERIVDGWIKTGDIGRLDANGYLYLLDRSDDKIISGGYNIYPSEIENVLAFHEEVLEVAVVGVPHPKWGEMPMAFCVVRPGASVTEEDIVDLVVRELGSYKKPGKVELRTEPLPRTAVGKLKRKALREPFWQGHDRRISGA